MKKLILIINICIIGFLKGQNSFNFADHYKVEGSGFGFVNPSSNLIEMNGYYYFTSVRLDAEQLDSMYFYKVSSNGTLIFKKGLACDFFPYKVISTLDNELLFVGEDILSNCDVIPAATKNRICKFDTNGDPIFYSSYQEAWGNVSKHVIQYSDSSYYAFTDSIIYHYDKNGLFLFRKNTGLTNISSALFDISGGADIYLSGKKNSANALCIVDASGIVTSTLSTPVLFDKMDFYGSGQILGMGIDGKLYKHSYNYVQLGASAFSPSIQVSDFLVSNDSMYCITSNSIQSYFVCDSSFSVVHSATMQSLGFTQKKIEKMQSQIAILSEAYSKTTANWPGHHSYMTLNAFHKLNSNGFTEDIALVSLMADSVYSKFSASSSTMSPNTYTIHFRAKVKVTNKGSMTLTKFNLNYHYAPSVDCGNFWYQQSFSVTVPLGDTVEIVTPFITNYIFDFDAPQSILTQSVCMFVTIPNGKADKYYQDNELCNIFNFPTDVGLKENDVFRSFTMVYPNPFSSRFVIESREPIRSVLVTDQLGRVLLFKSVGSVLTEIETEELKDGIYFLKIETEKGTVIKKVVKN